MSGIALSAAPAKAGPGLRIGVTDDPESLFAGLHWRIELAQLGPGKLKLQPGVDLGIVDGPIDFLIKGAAHFAWEVPLSSDLRIYPLAGPVLTVVTFDNPDGDDTDTGLGLDVGAGLGFDKFALELWVGLEDSPDISILASFTF